MLRCLRPAHTSNNMLPSAYVRYDHNLSAHLAGYDVLIPMIPREHCQWKAGAGNLRQFSTKSKQVHGRLSTPLHSRENRQ